MVEIVVSASMLLVVMSFVGSLVYRIDLVWRNTARSRAAINELSNQLEQLTLLSSDQLPDAIDALEPSAYIAQALPEAELTGELVNDKLGTRVILRLDWQREHPANPVELAGWVPADQAGNDAGASEEPPTPEESVDEDTPVEVDP